MFIEQKTLLTFGKQGFEIMLPLLPAYRASNFVDTIQTNDVHTGGVHTTLRPRQWRGRRHQMPALGCDGERVRHII